jgi:hypothetical protein
MTVAMTVSAVRPLTAGGVVAGGEVRPRNLEKAQIKPNGQDGKTTQWIGNQALEHKRRHPGREKQSQMAKRQHADSGLEATRGIRGEESKPNLSCTLIEPP